MEIHPKKKNLLFIILLSFFMQACFPVYKTIRPFIEVQVVDENGQSIRDAKVVRMTDQTPARVSTVFDVGISDHEGLVRFEQKRKWEFESFIIHGVQYYSWTLCVSKQGYKTIDQIKIDENSNREVVLNLQRTKSKTEPCSDES